MAAENGKILIFTDGSSRGNPGPGGWGSIVIEIRKGSRKVMELGGGGKNTTNNRMELRAFIAGLNFLNAIDTTGMEITVYTDSSYVLKGTLNWLPMWARNGWKTAANKEVVNRDLWQDLLIAVKGKKFTIKLLPGHVGIKGNERCDEIATQFADGKNPKLFSGSLEDYGQEILNVDFDRSAQVKRSESRSRSRSAAYSYVSKVKGKVMVHKTWAECEARVKGAPGALFKKALSASEEKEIITDFESRK